MTLLTSRTFLSLVLVILLVTAETIHGRLSQARQVLMARSALDRRSGVRVTQNISGRVVTKTAPRILPVTLAVTIPAALAKRCIVLVVFPVTGKTIPGSLLEHCTLVAFLAFNLGMLSQQGETAQIVVELLCWLLPASLTVTARTVFSQGTLVLVVLGMAGIALLAQLATVEIAGVASHTRRGDMLATQSVLGIGIVTELAALPEAGAMAGFTLFTE